LAYSKEIRKKEKNNQGGLFENSDSYKTEIKLEKKPEAKAEDKLNWEKELLGLFITGNPLDKYDSQLKKTMPIEKAKRQMSDKKVRIGGMISLTKTITTKKGNQMMFLTVKSKTDEMEAIVFPDTFQKYKPILEENNIIFLNGKISHRDENPKIIAEKIKKIKEK